MNSNWIKLIKKVSSASLSRVELREMVEGINLLLKENKLQDLNDIMKTCDVDSVSSEIPICLLRCTFSARNLIPEWSMFLEKVKQSFQRRGLDIQRGLSGLF